MNYSLGAVTSELPQLAFVIASGCAFRCGGGMHFADIGVVCMVKRVQGWIALKQWMLRSMFVRIDQLHR